MANSAESLELDVATGSAINCLPPSFLQVEKGQPQWQRLCRDRLFLVFLLKGDKWMNNASTLPLSKDTLFLGSCTKAVTSAVCSSSSSNKTAQEMGDGNEKGTWSLTGYFTLAKECWVRLLL